MNMTIFTVLLLVHFCVSTSSTRYSDMVCCVKDDGREATAIFTCGDPGDYCSDTSCEEWSNYITQIQIIDCTFSKLPYNVFDILRRIATLNISNIGLESIERDYFENETIYLDKLYASNNKLKSLSEGIFSKNSIKELDLSKNQFESIGVIERTNLKSINELNLSNNEISVLNANEFTGLRTLSVLDLSFNKIEVIPAGVFEKIRNLLRLYLSSNKLTTFVANSFPNLIELDLSHNQIDAIENAHLRGKLQRLIVRNNKIFKLSENTFKDLTELLEIDFSFNTIETIETGTFWKLKNLKRLTLAQNRIAEFQFWDLPISIEHINVSFNALTSLKVNDMTNLKKVITFNIGSNNISAFSGFRPYILPSLKYVDFTRNNMPCSELILALNSFGSYTLEIEIQPNSELVNRSSYRGVQCFDDNNDSL